MKIGKNNSTNAIVTRFWSAKHYGKKHTQKRNMFDGSVTDEKTQEEIHFHTPSQFLAACETLYKKAEKRKSMIKLRDKGG